jgi:superfamily II DNA or RNA helicase
MLQMRDYQIETINAIETCKGKGIYRTLVALPTGTGKTVVFAHLIKNNIGNSLVLVHRDELISQAIEKFNMICPELEVGVIKAERNEFDKRVTVASVQSLSREKRLMACMNKIFSLIITDEAHHSVADSYMRIYQALYHDDDGKQLHVGMTATPNRADKAGLGIVYQKIAYQKTLIEMIQRGWLCDLRCVAVSTKINLDGVSTRMGDFAKNELANIVNTDNRNDLIVESYKKYADGRISLCFGVDVAHATTMTEAFNDADISSAVITGDTPIDERHEILSMFHNGDIKVLCNCEVLTEGFDEPAINCIILARPTQSSALYTQMIGRGTRTFPGKKDCLILDVSDNYSRHNLMQAPNLFNMKRKHEFNGKQTVTEMLVEEKKQEEKLGITGKGTEAKEVNIYAGSNSNWVIANGDYNLSIGQLGTITVSPLITEQNKYVAIYKNKNEKRILTEKPTGLTWSLGIAETEARKMLQGNDALIDKNAKWRFKPASKKQIDLLKKLKVQFDPKIISAGEASNLIANFFYKRGRY